MADTTSTPTAHKPGFRTSEFWLSLAAVLLGALFASGVLADGGTAAKIAGLAASLLGALGYTVSRTQLKAGSTPS